ncbi:hypothetical protein COOONC_14639 [Cooperia oncophora]
MRANDSYSHVQELHLFRETVFRRIMREKMKSKGVESTPAVDEFETIDTPLEEIPSAHILNTVHKEENRGLYGWITSFFTQEESNVKKDEASDFGKFETHEFKDLPKSFNVKEMEEEILDVLHESWDDSTLLRRDVLLAEIAMRLEHMTHRFVDTVEMEEEILDVLHESWDDSTLLRRDVLLAEIAMRLEHMTLRFVDTVVLDKVEQRRVLAMDLTGVTSRVELSPRQHSLVISLAVYDMSIQRLRIGHPPPKDGQSDYELDQSFMFSVMESTKILLAVGRKDSNEDNSEPMFRMLYRRRSPRLTVRHNVEGSFRPVSVMYEENALSGLSTLFSDDPNMFTSSEILAGVIPSSNQQIMAVDSHIFVNLHIPSVTMELRRRGWDERKRSSPEWEAGDPFACLTLQNVSVGYVTREAHVSKIKLGVGHLELGDLMERTTYPLLSTRGTFAISKTLSTSCPDLSTAPSSQQIVSSSLPSRSLLEDFAAVHVPRKISTAVDGKRSAEEREATILITLVDPKHPQFESKHMKV